MKFNDTTNLDGIIQDCEMKVFGGDYGAISGNTTLLKRFTALCNQALDKVVSKILTSDTRWQWGDNNNTEFSDATTNMTAGIKDYRLDLTHLKIMGVEVKKSDGTWQVLTPIDQTDIQRQGIALEEFMNNDGVPQYYDKVSDGLVLYPAPSASETTLTLGLKIYYQEGANHFVYTDTTKEPGFNSLYHYLIPLYASIDYAKANIMKDTVLVLQPDIDKVEMELQTMMSKRDKDDKPKLRLSFDSFATSTNELPAYFFSEP